MGQLDTSHASQQRETTKATQSQPPAPQPEPKPAPEAVITDYANI